MKIDSLFENVTPSSTPVGNQSQQAPKFGRDPKVLEDDKIEETTAGATGSGAVASVSQPMGTIQKRKGTGALLRGISTSEKYPNSKAVKEDEIVEQDIIINPSMLTGPKPGFHNRMDMEGDTVKNSLHTIIRVADDLNDRIENHTQFPEWVSEKIGAIKSMMVNVMDYVISQQERGDDHVIDEFAVGEETNENAKVVKLNDYDQWLDKVDALGAEKHVQKNRTLIVAQSWDGNKVGEFDLKSNQGWVMSQGMAEGGFDIPEIPRSKEPKPTPKNVDENLRKWFKEKWVRFGPDGKIRGDCARGDDSEGKPKCLPQSKAHSLGKKGRASAAARKRREDPNPERSGKAINVATKKKTNEEQIDEKWSEKYKRSINCSNPKGFSQRAHCQGRKKNEDVIAEVMSNKGADEVRRIQQMLNSKFDANLDIDGVLGPLTIKSIKKFLPSSPAKKAPMPNKTPAVTGKKVKHDVSEEQLDEKCWTGYHKEGNKKMFGKTYPNCVKNTNEEQLDEKCWDTHKQVGMKKKGGKMVPNCVPKESVNEEQDLCPHCGGVMYEMSMMNEKKDACYYKVKSRYKVWPSAYASGALVKCRKKGAKNWGNKSESVEEGFDELDKYMKAKSALKPKGGSGIKSGTYGSPEHRKRGRPQGPRGGEGSGFPQKTSFSTVPHDYSARRKFKNDFDDEFFYTEEQTQQEKPAQEKETPNYLNTIKNIGTAALALKDKDLAELLKQELHQMLLNKTSGEPNR